MDKLAQEDAPLLNTPIESEQLIKGVWDKYFAEKHNRIVSGIRALTQRDPQIKLELTQMFPGFTWPEFADMPTQKSLQELASTVTSLMDNRRLQMSGDVFETLKMFKDQYDMMVNKLHQTPSKEPQRKPQPKAAPSPKVKQLQQQLGTAQTGVWNAETNNAFMAWLKGKGWTKYIANNKFTGKLDDALRLMAIEKASPEESQPAGELASNSAPQRQAERLERLKKLGK